MRTAALPLSFEPNRGQFDPRVRFVTRSSGATIFLTDGEAVMVLPGKPLPGKARPDPLRARRERKPVRLGPGAVLRMKLVGAAKSPRFAGAQKLPGVANYFIGKDPRKWRTQIPTYRSARFAGVYPGTDLVYYGNPTRLEYDFVLKPGADPKRIQLAFAGADRLRVGANGDLIATTRVGEVSWKRPYAYQMAGDRRVQVACDYVVAPRTQGVGFRLARYDARRPLVVDPTLVYSAGMGGTRGSSTGLAIAVDADGAAYVGGRSFPTDFPTTAGAIQRASGGQWDMFVLKLNAAGSELLYSTYLGGSQNDQCNGIAVDTAGCASVCGETLSADFPTTAGAFQTTYGGSRDACIARLNASGSALLYSTYLGGARYDAAYSIAVDSSGAAHVAGVAVQDETFPATPGAYRNTNGNGSDDGFVAKLNPEGSALGYVAFVGGSGYDDAYALALDATGAAYICGNTGSADLVTTRGALQTTYGGGNYDTYIAKLAPNGTALAYCTYLGGSSWEYAGGIAVGSSGAAYVCGQTASADFPTTPGAFQTALPSRYTASFVTKLDPAGSSAGYSTFIGGSSSDGAYGIAVDSAGCAHVVGDAGSSDFPTTVDALSRTLQGPDDSFLSRLDAAGSSLLYSTLLGGSDIDYGNGVAVSADGLVVVTGQTYRFADFPSTPGAYQPAEGVTEGAFVTAFRMRTKSTLGLSSVTTNQGATATLTASLSAEGSTLSGRQVTFTVDGVAVGSALTDGGTATISYRVPDDAPIGEHALGASFAGDASYVGSSDTTVLAVVLRQTVLAVQDVAGAPGATTALVATLTSGAVGLAGKSVAFTVAGVPVGGGTTDASGVAMANYTVPGGAAWGASLSISASFTADARHAASSASATLYVAKRTTSLAAADASCRRGRTVTLTATLTAGIVGVSGKRVAITVDGVSVGRGATNASGVATVSCSIARGMALGAHAIAATFTEDGDCLGSTATSTLTVQAAASATWVYPSPRTAPLGGTVILSAELFDATRSGAKLAGRTLSFTVDGEDAGSAVTTAGAAGGVPATVSYDTTGLSEGVHTVVATFAGDADYDGAFDTTTLTLTRPTTYVTAIDRTVTKGSTITLKGTLSRNGGFVSGATLTFKVDGTSVGTGTTNASGIATLNYTASGSIGAHALVTAYAGSAALAASSSTTTLTVQGIATRIYVPAVSRAYYDTALIGGQLLETVTGTKLNGKTLDVQIDGASIGTATTSGGQATVSYVIPTSLSVGDHTITVSFAGDAGYAASSQTGTLTVALATPRLTVTSPSVNAGSKVQLVAVLTRNGGYAPGRTVTFKVDGTVVGTATTNAGGKGMVIYTAALSAGSHTLTAEFAGDGALKPASASGTLTVNP